MPTDSISLDVLYQDNHLLVVNKPALLPTMGVGAEQESLLDIAKQYIRKKYHKPGNVYLGIVSRLDAPVTGVTVIARTSKAASRLSDAFRTRRVQKTYWAVVEGTMDPASGSLEHHLRKDERHRKVHVTHADCPGAQLARLSYQVLATDDERSLVEIGLETGRKHQIRVQLAKTGSPILGDLKYGSLQQYQPGIALHSRQLRFDHPVRSERMEFCADVPAAWNQHRQIRRLLQILDSD